MWSYQHCIRTKPGRVASISIIETRSGFDADSSVSLLYHACFIHIYLPLELFYLLKKTPFGSFKHKHKIKTDSGKQLCFILRYDDDYAR
jgi:hypothetical protein